MPASLPQIIPAEILLLAYRSGIFPMADSRLDEEVYWVEPRERAIFPLDTFRPSRSLAKVIRQDRFTVTVDAAFPAVIAACAAPRPDHPETWISARIDASYRALHEQGHAHSVECWHDGKLVGGLYGVGFDRVFCGESMFSRMADASKVALAWLVALLRHGGFELLDCQFMTEHLQSLGALAIGRGEYLERLARGTSGPPRMGLPEAYVSLVGAAGDGVAVGDGDEAGRAGLDAPPPVSSGGPASSPGKLILQSLTQTS